MQSLRASRAAAFAVATLTIVVLGATMITLASLTVAALSACAAAPAAAPPPVDDVPRPALSTRPTAHTVALVHVGDTEAGLLADLDRGIGGFARARAVIEALRSRHPRALVLHAGDTMIPSPELSVELEPAPGAPRRSALLAANDRLGVQAAALGNHDLDMGEAFLADAIKAAAFPWVASTVTFGGALAPLVVEETTWVHEARGRILRRGRACAGTFVDGRCDGVVVGIVGATPESLRLITRGVSTLQVPDTPAATVAALQRQVDALRGEGITVVVLLAHRQGIERDVELFTGGGAGGSLVGVDVVLSGGGENLLAARHHRLLPDATRDPRCPRLGEPCYPVVVRAVDGAPVVLVASDGDLRHVGELVVSFDATGVLTAVDARSRPWPLDDTTAIELRAEPRGDDVAWELRTRDALQPLARVVGETPVFLDGVRESVRNRETNLGDASSDAILLAARAVHADVVAAFRSGGGIRSSIGAVGRDGTPSGKRVTLLDVKTALRFDSPVVVVELSHAELARTLEAALRGAGSAKGGFPQVSSGVTLVWSTGGTDQQQDVLDGKVRGVRCDGTRLRRLVLPGPSGPVVVVDDGVVATPGARVVVATIDFLARGGDGWFPGQTLQPRATPATEQSSFIAWLTDEQARTATLSTPPRITAVDVPALSRCP
jgi:2',3'-cyclic-nucleotide 2'-phosphodiesterase (5'-nucleotidase family)